MMCRMVQLLLATSAAAAAATATTPAASFSTLALLGRKRSSTTFSGGYSSGFIKRSFVGFIHADGGSTNGDGKSLISTCSTICILPRFRARMTYFNGWTENQPNNRRFQTNPRSCAISSTGIPEHDPRLLERNTTRYLIYWR